MKFHIFIFILLFTAHNSGAQNNPIYYLQGENLIKKTAQFLFIKVTVDKKSAFEGESIRADYHLYVAVDLQGKMSKAPSYSGFASFDIIKGQDNDYKVEKINNVLFKIYHIKSVQLYGLAPGIQRIEPIAIDATIRYRKQPDKPTGNIIPSPSDTLFQFEVRSQPVEITIKPLPGKEDDFLTIAVGHFELSTALTSSNIAINEPDTLQIALTGKGNWHEVSLPDVVFPKGIEVFEPLIQEAYNEKLVPIEGVKVISYPFVSTEQKNIIFKPITFSFFNPEKKMYQTVTTDTLYLEVSEEKYKPEQLDVYDKNEQDDLTNLFSGFAIILFPLTAILLSVLAWNYYRKSKKG